MPATYAHYIFGKKVYKQLPQNVQQMIKENKEAFWLGLHGPDLTFYYRPLSKNRVNQTGHQMHKELASEIFEFGREQYQERPSYVLLSYLCGFLCHFVLDSECHPYISRYMEEHGLGHTEIETEFDRYLMVKDGKHPTKDICTNQLPAVFLRLAILYLYHDSPNRPIHPHRPGDGELFAPTPSMKPYACVKLIPIFFCKAENNWIHIITMSDQSQLPL